MSHTLGYAQAHADTDIQRSNIYTPGVTHKIVKIGKCYTNTQAHSMWAHRHRHKGTQQEEEEVLAREVGDEWALSKQHLAQEVPIGSFTQRKEVCLVCVWVHGKICGGGVDVTLWVQLTLKPQHSRVDSFSIREPVSISEEPYVLCRVKASQGKHLVSFSSTNFTQVI